MTKQANTHNSVALKTQFKNHIAQNLPFLMESRFLIAISGGIDSVVLAHLCHENGLDFALAHCNFHLRGKESDLDETFVNEVGNKLGVEVFVQGFETAEYAKKNKLSIQLSARELRYRWFDNLANALDFDYILTAHHADDNLETFLINLSRGTGLDGLTGIPETNGKLVRPLLPFSREDIEAYAKENNMKWREDSSNASTKYLRNKLRHDVIPKLKETNAQLLHNFGKTQTYLQQSRAIVEDRMEAVWDDVVENVSENDITFNIKRLKNLSNTKAYLFELFKDYGFTEWNDVADLLDAQTGKQVFSATHVLLKNRDELMLFEKPSEDTFHRISISESDKTVDIPEGKLMFSETETYSPADNCTVFVDKSLLKFPLTVRKWQKGDYFYPFGMQGKKKKLSKFFKDEKLSLPEKETTSLLCSGNDIVWVIGLRADERFKVTNETETILKIDVGR